MSKRDTLIASLLAVILVAVLLPYAVVGVDMHHDGIMLKPALDVVSGQVLFRDTFMQYGALTCYLQVAALEIFPRLLTLKLLAVGVYAFSLFLFYASWRQILPTALAACAGAMFILFIPHYERGWLGDYWIFPIWSSAFAMLFQSVALYALFHVIRDEQPQKWSAMLGAACACVWWCRQPVGITTTGCVVAIIAALNFAGWTPRACSKAVIFRNAILGFAAITLVLAGSIVFSGAGPEWWYQNYLWPKKWAEENVQLKWDQISEQFLHPFSCAIQLLLLLAATWPSHFEKNKPGERHRIVMVYFLCLAGVIWWKHDVVLTAFHLRQGGWTLLIPGLVAVQAVVSLVLVFRRGDRRNDPEYFLVSSLAAFSLGALPQYYPIADAWHVFWSISPAFGLFVFVFWRWSKWSTPTVVAAFVVALAPALWYKIGSMREFATQPLVAVAKPEILRGMQVGPLQATHLEQIANLLETIEHQRPRYPAVLIGNDAMYLCFSQNRQNPTPYFVTWTGLADNDHNQRRWDYIKKERPLLFIHKPNWAAVDDYYAKAGYEPLLYLQNEGFEIAVPHELVKSLALSRIGTRR